MNIFGTRFDYKARLSKVRKLMAERDLDAVLVHLWPNQYYISGMYSICRGTLLKLRRQRSPL